MSDYSELFELAFEQLIKSEGHKFVNHPKDPGGATKYGLTLKFLKAQYPEICSTEEELKELTLEQAKWIYYDGWWKPYPYLEKLPIEALAVKIFNMGVNIGWKKIIKQVQIAINRLRDKPIAVDGAFGPETFQAILDCKNEFILLAELRECCAHYYRNLVADNPDLQIFFDGWLRRAYD